MAERMRKLLITFLLLTMSLLLTAQKTGSWRDHFAYTQGVDVMLMPNQVIGATSVGLIFLEAGSSPQSFSKANGLSDFGISAAMYDVQTQRVFLGYENGNLDILTGTNFNKLRQGNQIKNIATWKSSSKVGSKRINRFLRADSKILVATGSRMLAISNDEIVSDFTINDTGDTLAIQDLAMFGDMIVAATSKGLYLMEKSNQQMYFYGSWQRGLNNKNIISLAVNGSTLYALQDDGHLHFSTDLQNYTESPSAYSNPRALSATNGELWLSTTTALYHGPGSNLQPYTTCNSVVNFKPFRVASSSGNIFIADEASGLLMNCAVAIPNGPQQNQVVALNELNGKIAAAGNSSLSLLENKSVTWSNATSSQIADARVVKINTQNAAEVFVLTSNNVEKFSASGLLSELTSSGLRGMDFDRNGNLFAFASLSSTPVKLRGANGAWSNLSNSTLQNLALGKAISTGRNFWGILGANQIYVYGTGSNAGDISDDKASTFAVQLSDDGEFLMSNIYAIAADRNNEVWVGTDKGVISYTSTSDPFTNTPKAQRIKLPNEMLGKASYLLENEKVTAIAVDGANRKWFGTRDAGVFLQAEDGIDQLLAFNVQNSPLPSNNVVDIAINSQTGEVIFATDKGMVGYFGDATGGKDSFEEVKVFPNPVRPNMNLVTITNLMEDASVRITDISGNLVFFATANGGTITWDATNLNGRRVATGVYLVFLADQSGQESKVVKLLVVN